MSSTDDIPGILLPGRLESGVLDYWRLGKSGTGKKDMKGMKTMKFMKGWHAALTWRPPAAASRSVDDSDRHDRSRST
jgi:hypothetical protein